MIQAPTPNCHDLRLALLRESGAELSAAEQDHLSGCRDCQAELAALEQTEALLREALRPTPLDAESRTRLERRVERLYESRRPGRLRLVSRLACGAAAAALLAVLYWSPHPHRPAATPDLTDRELSLLAEALYEQYASETGTNGGNGGNGPIPERTDETVRLPWSAEDDWDLPLPAAGRRNTEDGRDRTAAAGATFEAHPMEILPCV